MIMKLNKQCVNLVWGTTREVTKREIMYKSKEYGGLGAVDMRIKLYIAFIKNMSAAISRNALWTGDRSKWRKWRGRARQGPEYYLIYGDFMYEYVNLNIDWNGLPSKMIFKKINDYKYGGYINYKNLTHNEGTLFLKFLKNKNLSESIRDMRWLMSVNRLAVRAVVSWSCYVKTKKCPMINCDEDETQQHLLMDCYRAKEVWDKLKVYGVNFVISYKSVMYCIVVETLSEKQKELLQIIICIVCIKLWKTRCCMVIQQTVINSDDVCKQVLAELRRRKTLDKKQLLPWDTFNL